MRPYKRGCREKQLQDIPEVTRLEMMILAALGSKDRYGLEIVDTIKEATGDQVNLSLGSLYVTLHRMERKGLVIGRWGGSSQIRLGARRRYYHITALGKRALTESKGIALGVLRLVPEW